MRTDPFNESWVFLIGATPNHDMLGAAQYLLVALFWALLIASVAIAVTNWREDPAQRTAVHAWTWLIRVSIGAMWFEGSLWKLPLPVSPGLTYWTNQLVEHAAFQAHKDIVRDYMIPNLFLLNPLVYLAELSFAISMMLGFAVRLFALGAIAFTLHLYFGLFRHPAEWPWLYIFLIMVHVLFILHRAGRSLGLDALLRRRRAGALTGDGAFAGAYRLAS